MTASLVAHADGVSVVAAAEHSCSSQTVDVLPTSNDQLDGNFSVWARVQVDDFSYGWITDNWSNVHGITTHVFYGITIPIRLCDDHLCEVSRRWLDLLDRASSDHERPRQQHDILQPERLVAAPVSPKL